MRAAAAAAAAAADKGGRGRASERFSYCSKPTTTPPPLYAALEVAAMATELTREDDEGPRKKRTSPNRR